MPDVKKESFPIARKLLRFGRRWRSNWLLRHQHPVSYWLHLVGIPLTLFGLVSLFFLPWYYGIGAFVLGYLLQAIGHALEGNDIGELIPLKRKFGLPAIAVSPKFIKVPSITSPAT
jgi:Protein of unknown function (DUF962)